MDLTEARAKLKELMNPMSQNSNAVVVYVDGFTADDMPKAIFGRFATVADARQALEADGSEGERYTIAHLVESNIELKTEIPQPKRTLSRGNVHWKRGGKRSAKTQEIRGDES